MKPFYVTTPLYYVNAEPHIGHAYTTVAADVLSRFMRARGREAHLLSGTDEHGAKIEAVALAGNVSPQAWADRIAGCFMDLWKHLDIRHDDFIRTTEERHKACVGSVFSSLQSSGDIYKGKYSGFYCVSCETYWPPKEAPEIDGKRKCPNTECRRPLQLIEEESYFFRLSKYQERLTELYKNSSILQPPQRASEIIRFVKGGLEDIAISRTKVKWGIPVPGDPGHTIYVWFDALLNYVSALGYRPGSDAGRFKELWPADVHIVGKEIYRFHAVIWPAMLMALGVEPPVKVFAHGWWTVDGKKMSKSLGNFIDPREVTREFGVDALRYFLMREVPFGNDGDFSMEAMKRRYNAELANDLGNLLSRVCEMVDKYIQGNLPKRPALEPEFLTAEIAKKTPEIAACMERLAFSEALGLIWGCVRRLNEHINATQPFKLYKTDPEKVKPILFDLVWSLRIIAGWIEPFMPQSAARMQAQLGVRRFPMPLTPGEVLDGPSGERIQKGPPLFPRKP